MNVTAPFKLQAYALATERLERAELAGAANALKFEGDAHPRRQLRRHRPRQRHPAQPRLPAEGQARAGAGRRRRGARRAAAVPRAAAGRSSSIANRTVDKAHELAQQFAARGTVRRLRLRRPRRRALRHRRQRAPRPACSGELPPCRAEVFGDDALAYELVYGKGLTPFLRLAQNAGVPKPGRRRRHAGRAGGRSLRLVARRAARHARRHRRADGALN